MTVHHALRIAVCWLLVLAFILLVWGAVRAATALDRRLEETRYVVEGVRGCPIGRASLWTDQLEAQC